MSSDAQSLAPQASATQQDAGSACGVLNTGCQPGNSIGPRADGRVFIDRRTIRLGTSAPGVFADAVTTPGRRPS